jgi:ssDNA-binding Zn-finger/Zn-ribbon topoisomerase 1
MCFLIRFQAWHEIETYDRRVPRWNNGYVVGYYWEQVTRERRICPWCGRIEERERTGERLLNSNL